MILSYIAIALGIGVFQIGWLWLRRRSFPTLPQAKHYAAVSLFSAAWPLEILVVASAFIFARFFITTHGGDINNQDLISAIRRGGN